MEEHKYPVATLPHRLFLVTIDPDSTPQCLSSMRSSRFFAFTHAEDEVSLVLDEESWKSIPESIQKFMVVSPIAWRAVHVIEGESAIDATGIVAAFSAPLSRAGINMIYMSTFNTDVVLIQEDQLELAKKTLHSAFDGTGYFELDLVHLPSPSNDVSTTGVAFTPPPPTPVPEGSLKMPSLFLTTLPFHLQVSTLHRKDIKSASHSIMKFFLERDNNQNSKFFSYIEYDDDISIIRTKSDEFGMDVVKANQTTWRAILVTEGAMGASELGLVSPLSGALAANSVSLYYLSTVNVDFVLVPVESVKEAVDCLENTFSVMTEDKTM